MSPTAQETDTRIAAEWYESTSAPLTVDPGSSATTPRGALVDRGFTPTRTDREVTNWWVGSQQLSLQTASDLAPALGGVGRSDVTGATADCARDVWRSQPSEVDEPETEQIGQAANRVRMQLLMRQFALKQLSPEERARLDLVTERVRAMLPNITQTDFDRLEEIDRRQSSRRDERSQLWSSLGLG